MGDTHYLSRDLTEINSLAVNGLDIICCRGTSPSPCVASAICCLSLCNSSILVTSNVSGPECFVTPRVARQVAIQLNTYLSSMVSLRINRLICTCFDCPMRWARSYACDFHLPLYPLRGSSTGFIPNSISFFDILGEFKGFVPHYQ